ncbi:uncharacterized protein LOC142042169 [Buteo buteo]|uniref:uncharacterized protein LOC142042169 n=1 Tax=Buteo buteo TaxID=30397 RepID=UPI003EBDCE29
MGFLPRSKMAARHDTDGCESSSSSSSKGLTLGCVSELSVAEMTITRSKCPEIRVRPASWGDETCVKMAKPPGASENGVLRSGPYFGSSHQAWFNLVVKKQKPGSLHTLAGGKYSHRPCKPELQRAVYFWLPWGARGSGSEGADGPAPRSPFARASAVAGPIGGSQVPARTRPRQASAHRPAASGPHLPRDALRQRPLPSAAGGALPPRFTPAFRPLTPGD